MTQLNLAKHRVKGLDVKIDYAYDLDSCIMLSLKEMKSFDRYGTVVVNNNIVESFEEKKFYEKALINCGVYVVKKNIFDNIPNLYKLTISKGFIASYTGDKKDPLPKTNRNDAFK